MHWPTVNWTNYTVLVSRRVRESHTGDHDIDFHHASNFHVVLFSAQTTVFHEPFPQWSDIMALDSVLFRLPWWQGLHVLSLHGLNQSICIRLEERVLTKTQVGLQNVVMALFAGVMIDMVSDDLWFMSTMSWLSLCDSAASLQEKLSITDRGLWTRSVEVDLTGKVVQQSSFQVAELVIIRTSGIYKWQIIHSANCHIFEILSDLNQAVPNHLADESQTRQPDTPPDHSWRFPAGPQDRMHFWIINRRQVVQLFTRLNHHGIMCPQHAVFFSLPCYMKVCKASAEQTESRNPKQQKLATFIFFFEKKGEAAIFTFTEQGVDHTHGSHRSNFRSPSSLAWHIQLHKTNWTPETESH